MSQSYESALADTQTLKQKARTALHALIKKLHDEGLTPTVIVERTGVDRTTVYRVLKGVS